MKINQLKAGVIISYLTIITTVIVGLLITPYLLKKLGQAEYGLYSMIGSFVGTLTLLDFGLNHSIVRYISKYRNEYKPNKEKTFLSTILIMYIGISFVLLMIGLLLFQNLDQLLDEALTSRELKEAKIMFVILLFNLVILLPGNSFEAISAGYERFFVPRSLKLLKYLFRSLLLVAILSLGANAIDIVLLDTIMNIMLIIANATYVIKKLNIKIHIKFYQKIMFFEIFSYSFWVFLLSITQQFQWKISQFLIGLKTDTTNVAIISVSILLVGFYGSFGSAITSVFLPKATKMTINNAKGEELTDMMIKIGRISLISQLFILGGFVIFGKIFIKLWISDLYSDVWLFSLLLMSVITISFMQGFGSSILEAKKKVKFRSILFLTSIFSGITIGYFLIDKFGILGMILGLTFAFINNHLVLNIYYHKVINLNVWKFWKEAFIKIFFVFFTILILFKTINLVILDWKGLIFGIFSYSIIYSFIFYIIVLNKTEKQLIKNFL